MKIFIAKIWECLRKRLRTRLEKPTFNVQMTVKLDYNFEIVLTINAKLFIFFLSNLKDIEKSCILLKVISYIRVNKEKK